MKARIPRFLTFLLNKESKAAWEKQSNQNLTEAHQHSHGTNKALASWFEWVFKLHHQNFCKIELDRSLEIGSGGSSLKKFMPELRTSDILKLSNVDLVVDAQKMPFANDLVSNITMINVLHHIPKPLDFFAEADRVLFEGGRIVFTEPYISPFSYFIYKFIHHEPCTLNKNILSLPQGGDALFDSNQAMPTQLIEKHALSISEAAPHLKVVNIYYHTWLSYFLTGGVNYKPLLPYPLWKIFFAFDQWLCGRFGKYIASFFTVVMEKKNSNK